jgi:hypothetical protein
MAMPIRPTPWLDKESSKTFLARVKRESQIQAASPATPNIDRVIAQIVADANNRKK